MTTRSSHMGKIKAQGTALKMIMLFTDQSLCTGHFVFIISKPHSDLQVDTAFIFQMSKRRLFQVK